MSIAPAPVAAAGATDLGIRKASTADAAGVAATITAAFFDDPVTCWIAPDPARRRQIAEPLFRLYADAYVALDEVYTTADGQGVAVWLPPATSLLTPEQEAAFVEAAMEIVGPEAERLGMLEETFARYHPDEPLWYLNFLATVPAHQGRGIGSAFLDVGLRRADNEGMPAYHEATTLRNRALYQRHGYVDQGVFHLPDDGPPLWRMWREPQGPVD
jgi:GNAT superfamily N-acetyltransferase